MGAAASGEVGLGQDRHLGRRHHHAALEGGHHDAHAGPRQVGAVDGLVVVKGDDGHDHALLGQHRGQPRRRGRPLGAHRHRVAARHELRQARRQQGPVAVDGLDATRHHRRSRRRVGDRHHRQHRSGAVLEQPFVVDVQPREALGRSRAPRRPSAGDPRDDAPGDGEGAGQGGLLVVELGGAVTDAAGIDEHDPPTGPDQVGQDPLVVDEPRQPRLHPVEDLALGQSLPLRPSPRLGADQRGGPGPHRLGGKHLAASEELDLVEVRHRTLVAGVELGEPVHLVAPQVDAHRQLGRGGVHVDDPAPHRQLAPVLDLVLAPVAEGDEPGHQLLELEAVAPRHDDRGRRPPRPDPGAAAGRAPGATITAGRGGRGVSCSRHSRRSRRPIVDSSGLTRSKGRVSQAGNSSTTSSPRNAPMSWPSRSASRTVGVTTSRGRRSPNRHIPATT